MSLVLYKQKLSMAFQTSAVGGIPQRRFHVRVATGREATPARRQGDRVPATQAVETRAGRLRPDQSDWKRSFRRGNFF